MPVSVITGASKGLGLELTRQLAARGEHVFALVRKANADLAAVPGNVTVIEGVDVTSDDAMTKITEALGDTKVDCLINNAGAYGGPVPEGDPMAMFAIQSLTNITPDVMRDSFELNTIAPLRVTKAVLPKMAGTGAKVIIITSLMGSIADNGSGGSYAYRAAKAAVNMVGKSLAMDLKDKGIAVGLVHPGAVKTHFVGGGHAKIPEKMAASMHDVEPSVRGVIEGIDATTMENTGCFVHGNYGEGIKPCPW
mmetsp:Transcript_23983/g.64881  ORF Transcript_23983/g.64881 Transcript_23983/m.64881 type:complete len:251 (-) Transcript_23983:427-1179(-)